MRRLLVLDAAGMAAVGAGYLVAAAPLGRLFGPGTAVVAGAGAVMVAGGAAIAAAARGRRVSTAAARAVVGGGALWVALSLAALAFGWLELTTTGLVWTWLQIAPVALFAALETGALRARKRGA
ncbi:hypothetical protein AC230_11465 [Streptomyces caatingaensis]|uniref:Integral membrane protein n=1 Tax=Streptomyces caatingaensis TaxID=1678637 RepID=A0A0K9XGK6_9ACTN|nr:hypothetical protein AC230_11465 [Streptomyces caatingaensis]